MCPEEGSVELEAELTEHFTSCLEFSQRVSRTVTDSCFQRLPCFPGGD